MNSNIKIGNTSINKTNNESGIKMGRAPSLLSKYHTEELKQNKAIVYNAIGMIWIGIGLIIASFVVYVVGMTETMVTGTVCGGLIDLFSATILYLFNKSSENKQNYFNNLSNTENEQKIIDLVKEISDEQIRNKLIEELINKQVGIDTKLCK